MLRAPVVEANVGEFEHEDTILHSACADDGVDVVSDVGDINFDWSGGPECERCGKYLAVCAWRCSDPGEVLETMRTDVDAEGVHVQIELEGMVFTEIVTDPSDLRRPTLRPDLAADG